MIRYPYLEVAVRIGTEWLAEEALLDTGYDGALIIPAIVAPQIPDWPSDRRLVMPDGHVHLVDVWTVELLLEDRGFEVEATAFGEDWIIGRDIMKRMEVCFEFGRSVRIPFED